MQAMVIAAAPRVDWGQKASATIGFTKATEALMKKPHITLTKPQFLKNVF
jgi:hypothetical protein